MTGGELRVLHVDAAREYRGGQDQARLLMKELAGPPGVGQALAARAGSRLAREAERLGLTVVPLPWGPAVDPRAVAGLAARLGDHDVAHAHSSHALQAALLGRALSGADVPVVAARRVDFPLRSPGVWRRAELVLAISRPVRRVLVASGVEPERIRVVHSSVDPEELTPQRPGALREAAGADEDTFLVGAVGALVGHKDHRTFVRAAARVAEERPDVRFVVAGEGPEREALEELVARLGLGDRLRLPGHVPGAARSLADLDLYVMSSREEGLGTATLEAMALGVPPLVTRAGGLRDVAGGVLPAVPPEDPAALAEEILRLARDEAARRRLGEAARERAARFSSGAMARGTLSAYRAVVGSAWKRRVHLRRARGRPVAPPPPELGEGGAGPPPVAEAARA